MNSFTFRNVSEALPALCKAVLENGDEVGSRNGRTMELPFTHITLTHPWERYITTPGRRASLPAQICESMWILAGRNDIEWLSHYLPRAAEFSDDGKTWRGGYGPRLRGFGPHNIKFPDGVDQLGHVVDLLKRDPLTRRAVMSIYDPQIDSVVGGGKDIPCNDFIQFMSRLGKLDMHVFIRSNDLMWGWSGINAFEWSALQEIVASLLGIQIGYLHFSISSLHLYDRHWKKAEELSRADEFTLSHDPQFDPVNRTVEDLDVLVDLWFNYERIIREEGPEAARKGIAQFPEPMMRNWLVVIAKYHDPEFHWPDRTNWSDAMIAAWQASPKKPEESIRMNQETFELTPFVAYVDELHREKHKAYGDSWKRRGEMLGIMANIARKIDRLGTDGAGDTATDTAVDLLVYLILYRWWLTENAGARAPLNIADPGNEDDQVADTLRVMQLNSAGLPEPVSLTVAQVEADLRSKFDKLEVLVEEKREGREMLVQEMAGAAFWLARHLHWKEGNETRSWNPS